MISTQGLRLWLPMAWLATESESRHQQDITKNQNDDTAHRRSLFQNHWSARASVRHTDGKLGSGIGGVARIDRSSALASVGFVDRSTQAASVCLRLWMERKRVGLEMLFPHGHFPNNESGV
jgi:hypothetical protein